MSTAEERIEALSNALSQTMQFCINEKYVESAERFLADYGDLDRVTELLQSPDPIEVTYGTYLLELRQQAEQAAAGDSPDMRYQEAPDPVTTSRPLNPALREVPLPEPAPQTSRVATPIPDRTAPTPQAPLEVPVQTQPADDASPPPTPDARGAAPPLKEALRFKLMDLLQSLDAAPVTRLRLPSDFEAVMHSPLPLTEEHQQLVTHVIAPLMAAAGLLAIELVPHYYDPFRGKETPLDMQNPSDRDAFARMVLR